MKQFVYYAILSLCLCLAGCQNQEDINRPPQFLWESFQRFWSKYESPFVSLSSARKVVQGYTVDYGFGVMLTIYINDGVVSGAEVVFPETGRNNEGGKQFLRLIDQLMEVGTFRWTSSEMNTMRNFFGPINPTKKELKFKNSYFIRQRNGINWSFKLDFIANTLEMWTNPPLPVVEDTANL